MHDFHASRQVEARWTPVLDAWLGRRYWFQEATMDEQWRGIDRVAIDDHGRQVGIDYKCDEAAARTGNIFVETVSNTTTGRRGWAVAGQADWIFYLVAPSKVLVLLARRLRSVLPSWQQRFGFRLAWNRRGSETYATQGVCVLLECAEREAEQVADLDSTDEPSLRRRDDDAAARTSLADLRRVASQWWSEVNR